MGTKNTVTAGGYKGGRIELKVKLIGSNEVILIKPGMLSGKLTLDNKTIASYEVVDAESQTSATSAVARGAVGVALFGPIGIAAALSAKKKGLHTIALQFKDGKSSLIEVDKDIYKTLVNNLFQANPAPVSDTPQPINTADEIAKFKTLLDAGAITQDEYEAKKKQLLGL
ncbi:MAG: SHOCT domain-containing protein [Clostridiales bacterium]|jgi:hypothetical protein|nr:SHOCT domain-containing protein [Clostridiales bacterium]